jgi:hypothetical protein
MVVSGKVMNKRINITRFFFATILFFLFSFVSCTKKEIDDNFTININPKKIASEKKIKNNNNHEVIKHPGKNFQSICSGGTLVIVCGSGYNDNNTVSNITHMLQQVFGLTSEDKSLLILTYPNDFMIGDSSSINLLLNKLDGNDIASLIILGSPPNTHKVLAGLQDKKCIYPVFSLFPQDDILGTEAGSTAVIDIPTSEDDMLSEEQAGIFEGNINDIIEPLVAGILQGWTSFSDNEYLVYVSDEIVIHTGYKLRQYIDPETGIKSDNHYVLVN